MNTAELAELFDARIVNDGNPKQEIKGGYCGDFLSFVMGRAPTGSAWLTVMSNVNVAAVAVMAEVGAVVVCEGVTPDAALVERCRTESINLITTPLDVYGAAARLAIYEDKL